MPSPEQAVAWISNQTGLTGSDLMNYIRSNPGAFRGFSNDYAGMRQLVLGQAEGGNADPRAAAAQLNAVRRADGSRGMSRNVGNANWEAIAAFQNLPIQEQYMLAMQGLAPSWNGISMADINANGGVTMDVRTGRMTYGNGGAGPQAGAFGVGGGTPFSGGLSRMASMGGTPVMGGGGGGGSVLDQARAAGFRPTGPSGNWAQQAAAFMAGGGAGAGGGGIPGMQAFNQKAAVDTQGAVSQLNQQAAATGDMDRLAYKQARLRKQLEAGKRQGQTGQMLQGLQVAQLLGQAQAEAMPGSAAYRSAL